MIDDTSQREIHSAQRKFHFFQKIKVTKMILNSYFLKREGRGWGVGGSDPRLDVRKKGGGHSDAYCVQQGRWGGLKIGKRCVRN